MIAATDKPENTGLKPSKLGVPASLRPVAGVLALIGVGDFLLWDGWLGISWTIYLLCVTAMQVFLHLGTSSRGSIVLGTIIALVSVAPTVEDMNLLSAGFSTIGVFAACLVISNSFSRDKTVWINQMLSQIVAAPGRFPKAVSGYFRSHSHSSNLSKLGLWFFPASLALVFVLLFVEASPVWKSWWQAIDFSNIFMLLFSARWMFWIVLAWFSLPFLSNKLSSTLRFRRLTKWVGGSFQNGVVRNDTFEKQGGVQFFIRCLILFNLVFAVQTMLDLQFLWGSAKLPDGMTYAQYAHRGAYPLVVAALLAACFVLIATRPGGAGEQSAVVKWLVIGWVAQNLMLVFSSVERLNLYVATYAMTYWRIAAFIWMGLVAVGLILIVYRFVAGKSCYWLFVSNFVAMVLVLYVTCFVNLPGFITSYNLNHSRLVEAKGRKVDWGYVWSIRGGAYPAVAEFNALHYGAISSRTGRKELRSLQEAGGRYYQNFPKHDWRNWSFRQQRAYWVWKRFGNEPTVVPDGERAAP